MWFFSISYLYCVLSIISGLGDFGVRPHAKITRLPRFIEMLLFILKNIRDGLFPDHRSHGLLFLKGTPGERIMAELFGKATGVCSGKGGSLHSADQSVNNFGDNAVEGSYMVTALGVALGWQMQGSDALVALMLGDGTAGEGAWHESLNLAATWQLPVLYCCDSIGYSDTIFGHTGENHPSL